MKSLKIFSILGAVAILGGSLVSCGEKEEKPQLDKIKVGLHQNYGAGAGYSAINQGFFEEYGIEAEPSIGDGPTRATAVMSGELQISFMGNGVAWHYFKDNSPIEMIALDNLTDDDRLIVTNKDGKGKDLTLQSSLTDIANALKGAKLACDLTATPAAFLNNLLVSANKALPEGERIYYLDGEKNAIPADIDAASKAKPGNAIEVTSISNANLTAAVKNSQYDFAIAFAPVATTIEKLSGFKTVCKTSTHFSTTYTPSTWAVNKKWKEANPELFERTLKALVKGMNFRAAHPEKTAQDVEKLTNDAVAAESIATDIAVWLDADKQLELINSGKAVTYATNIRNSHVNGANKDNIKLTVEQACNFTYLKKACEDVKAGK